MASLRHSSLLSLTQPPIRRSEAPPRLADMRMVAKATGSNGAHSCEWAFPLGGEPDPAVTGAQDCDLPEPLHAPVPTLTHQGRQYRKARIAGPFCLWPGWAQLSENPE